VKPVDAPLVSVVLAAHDAAPTLRTAVDSVLRQTFRELELIVVDDGSEDETGAILASVEDARLVVLRNATRLGLAPSLNAGLDRARGRWVARLDADDVACKERVARQLSLVERRPDLAIVGTAVLELDGQDRLGAVHRAPPDTAAITWHALFGAPFFHPTVLLDRVLLEQHALRYDTAFGETEDYELWTRLLDLAPGANLRDALVLRRVHAAQASKRRSELQEAFQRQVALPRIEAAAAGLTPAAVELAWRVGAGKTVEPERCEDAGEAYLHLLGCFERDRGPARTVRRRAARALARLAVTAAPESKARLVRAALSLEPSLPVAATVGRLRRRPETRAEHESASAWLRELRRGSGQLRVAVVSPEPTPYRSPLFDRVAKRAEIDLTVIYAGRTVAGRAWLVEPAHRAVFLRGIPVPGARRLLRHDYTVTPGVFAALAAARPDVLVVSGWSTFASQAAIAWSRRRRLPYVLLVSSHDRAGRSGWRRRLRGLVVPRLASASAGALALGTLSRDSLVANGVPPGRVRVFANTVDVEEWAERADRLRGRRAELRGSLGAGVADVVVLSVARLAREKGLDVLLRAVATLDGAPATVVIAGSGPERAALAQLAGELGVDVTFTGDLDRDRLFELYVAADVFALLSSFEPWGVVVNEAAASGLPLVLSDQVGAGPDLLRDGENGVLVPAGDVTAAAAALRKLVGDPAFRTAAGRRSRELVAGWGYEPSVDSFVQAVREAAAR
jgi:glycosyltransferase involved in cell wall biosynthesis